MSMIKAPNFFGNSFKIRLRFSYDHRSKNQLVYWVYRKVMNVFLNTKPNAGEDDGFHQRITSTTSNRKKP